MASKKSGHRVIIEQLQLEQKRLKELLANGKNGMTDGDLIELSQLEKELTSLESYAARLCARIDRCAERIKSDGA